MKDTAFQTAPENPQSQNPQSQNSGFRLGFKNARNLQLLQQAVGNYAHLFEILPFAAGDEPHTIFCKLAEGYSGRITAETAVKSTNLGLSLHIGDDSEKEKIIWASLCMNYAEVPAKEGLAIDVEGDGEDAPLWDIAEVYLSDPNWAQKINARIHAVIELAQMCPGFAYGAPRTFLPELVMPTSIYGALDDDEDLGDDLDDDSDEFDNDDDDDFDDDDANDDDDDDLDDDLDEDEDEEPVTQSSSDAWWNSNFPPAAPPQMPW